MGFEINSNDKMYEMSFHQRSENEEMSREEFECRLSIFLAKADLVDLDWRSPEELRHPKDLRDNRDVSYIIENTDEVFNFFDKDKSGGISFEELGIAAEDVSKYSKIRRSVAEGLTKYIPWEEVPDNPVNVLDDSYLNKKMVNWIKEQIANGTKPRFSL